MWTSHHRSTGKEGHGKRQCLTIFLERMREGHRQADMCACILACVDVCLAVAHTCACVFVCFSWVVLVFLSGRWEAS